VKVKELLKIAFIKTLKHLKLFIEKTNVENFKNGK